MARSRHYDFYSPFMSAWIVQNPEDPQGTRFPLWVEGVAPDRRSSLVPRPPDGQSDYYSDMVEDLGSLAFCTEITVELQLAFIPKITASLHPPFRDGLAFLNSSLIEWGNSILEVQFGYVGGTPEDIVLSPVFSGVLLKPEVSIGEDISITLNAQGIGGYTSVRQDWVQVLQNKTRRKVIRALCRVIGLEANFEEVDAPFEKDLAAVGQQVFETVGNSLGAFELDQVTKQEIENARKRIYQNSPMEQVITVAPGGQTVWQVLYQVVREAQCWMCIQGAEEPGEPEQLRIIPRNSVMTGEPHCTLVLYDLPDGEIGPARNTFPIESVSSPTSAIYLPSATRGFLVFGYDSKERAKAVEVVDPNSKDVQRSGNAQTQANSSARNPAANTATGEGMAVASSDSMSPEYAEQIRAETESAATNMGVKLEITTLGIPDLVPAHVVAVRGIGARFEGGSGNYGVFTVTHTLGSSGYSTKLEAVSNVGQLAGTFDRETLPKTKTNEQKPETPDGTNTSEKRKKQPKKAR